MYNSFRLLKSLTLILMSVLALTTFNTSAKTEANSKVAIITGSNRGQGLGWTKFYLEKGYTVIATARKPESTKSASDQSWNFEGTLSHQKAPPGAPLILLMGLSRNESSTAFFSH